MKLTKKITEFGETKEVLDLTKGAIHLTKQIEKLVIKYKYPETVKVERAFGHDATYVTLFFRGGHNTAFNLYEWHKEHHVKEVLQSVEEILSGNLNEYYGG